MKQLNTRVIILVCGVVCILLVSVRNDKLKYVRRMVEKQIQSTFPDSQNVEIIIPICPYCDDSDFLPKFPNPKKFMIYECDGRCGGLADRQKGIVAAYLLSLLTNRTFGIINTEPTAINEFLRPNLVNWEIERESLHGLSRQCNNSLGVTPFLNKLPYLDLDKFYTKDVVIFRGNVEYVRPIRKHFKAPEVFPKIMLMTNSDVYNVVLRILFRLSEKLEIELRTFFKEKIKSKTLVCAHMRMGKNPSLPHDIKTKLALENIHKIWDFLKQFNNSQKYAIFVASDSDEVKAIAKGKFNQQLVDIPGKIVHIDQIGYRNESSGFKKIFLEQSVLSRCDVLLLTKSGFSRIASYMRNRSNNLYCFLEGFVVPCRHDLLDQIFRVV